MYDLVTIGDSMKDIFIFPSVEEMEKPLSKNAFESREHYEKYLVFGLGDKITVSDVEFSYGGTALNVAAGASKLGLKSAVISAVGADESGKEIIRQIESKKIAANFIKTAKNKKTAFSVIISYKADRTIFVYHSFSPVDYDIPKKLQTNFLYLGPMAEGYEKIYNCATNLVVKAGIKVAINPGSVQIREGLRAFGGLIDLIDILFLNREEAIALSGLSGVPQIREVARKILSFGPQSIAITDGASGAYFAYENEFYKIGPAPSRAIEATGAGDAFASAFLAAKIRGLSPRDCLKWGVTNAGSVIEKVGAQSGLLGAATIRSKVKNYRWPADSMRFA